VKSLMNITSVLGFPFMNCNGMIASMGLSISVDHYFPAPSIVGLLGEDNVLFSPCFLNVSD